MEAGTKPKAPVEAPESVDVVHPEVRAHITSLVSALGGIDEDGQYQLGDDALDVLRDIKKWIRFYDQKLNRMDVARCLAETNLVGGDLLAILATWHENATLQRFRARVALACYEILTPLTWPLEKDLETMTVNHHRHLPVLQLAQVAYKRAIINYDGAQILHTAVRAALPAMAVPLADRSLRDQGVIKLVLFFLRNVVMIEPAHDLKYDGDESQISRSATIDAFSYQDIFLVLLTIASNMGEDFRTEDTTVMEIIFHLVKRVDTAKLFMDEAQLNTTKASELTDMMKKEASMLQAFNKNGPTRHSRFGTMVWVDRGEGKMSALSGQDALLSTAARERKMDNSKKFRPPRRGRKRDEKQELVGLGGPVALNARANGQLRKFVEEFLDAGFNPLFQHIRKSIDREAPHVQHHHRAQFFYLVSWFLEAERVRQKTRKAQQKKEAANRQAQAQMPDEISSFNLVAGVLNQEMFIFLGRALDRSNNDKDWPELTVVMRCFTQILLTVQEMSESKVEEDEEIAENILSRLFYEETTHDAVTNIVKNFKDQGYEYLDACTELAHTYLRILEAYSKQNVDLQVRSRRRTRKKKKAAKASAAAAAAAGAANGESTADGDAENLIPDNADDDDESGNDEAEAQKMSTERSFDFKRFASRFVVQPVVDTFVKFITFYRDLTDAQLKRAHRYFYRVAFKQDMSVMLFRVDIIRLLFNMIKGPEPLDRQSAMYKDWEELSKQILRKCTKKIEERPVLIIEMLFSKTPGTAHYLEYGYEKQTVSASAPRPGAALEFREELDRDRQIAILVGVLLDKNQHDLLTWIKNQVGMAGAERRAWKAAEIAMAAANSATAAAEGDAADRANPSGESSAAAIVPQDPPIISIRPGDDACKKAMFKNPHLRLLMKLVGMERLAPSVDETPDSSWIFGPQITADELEETLEYINRAEFDPPTFDNNESAEDQLKRKPTPRKRAAFDDDDGDNGAAASMDDDFLFPAGGPTARNVIDEDGGTSKRKKTIRQRRKKTDENGDEIEGPTEEELDERARLRRQKELEKARRIKSDVYVHASDDETDDEKDRAFFEREEATRKRIHNAVQESMQLSTGDSAASDAAASKKTKPKRKSAVLSDDDDDDDDDGRGSSDADPGSSQDSASSLAGARRSRKRRKSSEGAMSTDEDDDGDDEGGDGDDGGGGALAAAVKKPAPKRRQHAGFVDSSDEEDNDDDAPGAGDAMDVDVDEGTPGPVLSEQTGGKIQLNGNTNADTNGAGAGADDDDDDIMPATKKRARAKSGFVIDSDDE
ncbi:Topoisomerase 1-associated factor 1 [Sporothrix curviconia]|uniref:Topoisomerase 1-associated factor 1 n=1 Tax=Sporothrix curviconia TaxID=1260050 RepID=A0ABP0B9J6_9PEZI